MKRLKKLTLIIMMLIQIASCKKTFLKPQFTSSIEADLYIVNIQTTEELLNGIYLKLATGFYSQLLSLYPDLIADNCKPRTTALFVEYSWTQMASESTSSSTSVNDLWRQGYNIIRDCNYIIENVDRFRDQDPAKADNIKGQAYAIRALLHHHLVNAYAQPYLFTSDASHPGIPYVTVADPSQVVSRQTVAEVYTNIIADLDQSIQLMSSITSNKVVVNRNSAKALLARVYLFKGDYIRAKDLSREIGAAVPIMTGPNYPSKLFATGDVESLFWLPPSQTPVTSFHGNSTGTAGVCVATNDISILLNERPTDLRKIWVKDSLGIKYIRKFPQGAVAGITNPLMAYYQTVIRSSEMYLTAAECYAKIGNEDSARYYLDAIRKRADPTVQTIVATGGSLLDSVYKERRKELCFEGLRMFDLLRTGKGVNRTDVTSPAAAILPYPSDKAIAPIPIPDIIKYSLSQNPGY